MKKYILLTPLFISFFISSQEQPAEQENPVTESVAVSTESIEKSGCDINKKSEIVIYENKENCVICYEEFNKMNKLKCNHKFRFECLSEWLNDNKKCPICLLEL